MFDGSGLISTFTWLFWQTFIIYMSQSFKHHLQMTLFVILFAGKLRRCLSRYRKRRELIEEWLDLEINNITCIAILTQKVTACRLSKSKAEAVLCGLQAISAQSHITIQKLQAVLGEKGMEFGSRIVQICVSFEAYEQFLRKHVERQMIMKEMEGEPAGWRLEHLGAASDKVTIEETAQKIVLRTYQLSLLVGKYFKCLRKGNDLSFFQNAITVLTNINKKHDHLLRLEQKLKEKERIERLMDTHFESNFLYSQKCHWHMGQATLHVFETMVALESGGRLHCFDLDQYCSVFSKSFDGLHMGCLVAKTSTIHLIFAFGRQLGKFLRVLDNLIHVNDGRLSSNKATAIFPPFMAAQVVDFRESRDLRGNQRDEFTIIFSAIVEDAPLESDQVISSMRESGLNWSEVNFCSQPQQLNETVTLSVGDLQKIREVCEQEYGLQRQLPELKDFSGQASQRLLRMLQWESLLNGVLRSRTAINNPILLLKQLQVTDVFLESSLSRANITNTQRFHCRLCACLDASSLEQFFRRRLRFLARKYSGQEKEYCYYIFQKIREEVNKVSQYELTSYSQLIAWRQLRSGRVDYSFRKRMSGEKKWFVDVVLLGVDERNFEVEVNQYTLVNEVIDQICLLSNVPALFAFRLAVCFEDQELLLKPNELVFPLLSLYNIKYDRSYSPTLFSKFKSFGRLLQFSENGMLVLKQVIFYPLGEEEQVQREWEEQYMAYQFKCQRLIGLPRESRLDIIVLLSIQHLIKKEKELPAILTHTLYDRYVPNSLEQQIEENKSQLQKMYSLRKGLSKSEVCELIEARLSASPFYRSYVWEMRVRDMSEGLTKSKRKVKGVMVGVGWSGITILSLNGIPVFRSSWPDCSISLGTAGLSIFTEEESITLKGLQLYQAYWLCREYKELTEQATVLRGR